MEPRIQYVTSADGTRIAISTLGQGRPLIRVAGHGFETIETLWHVPAARANFQRLAETRMVVQYDARGTGLSQHDVSDFSLEARISDLEAVVERLGADRVDLMGIATGGITAIAYAARRTEESAHLVLVSTTARFSDRHVSPKESALISLINVNWEMYVQSVMLKDFGWTDVGRQRAETAKDVMTPEVYVAGWSAALEFDVTDLLPRIRCPSLVVHRRWPEEGISIEVSKALAASLPNARFVYIGEVHANLLASDWDAGGLGSIEEFLEEGDTPPQQDADLLSGTAVILFAEMERTL